jgi:hypothetical protein
MLVIASHRGVLLLSVGAQRRLDGRCREFAWLKMGDNDENNTITCDCRYLAGEGSEAISVQLIIEPKP